MKRFKIYRYRPLVFATMRAWSLEQLAVTKHNTFATLLKYLRMSRISFHSHFTPLKGLAELRRILCSCPRQTADPE